MKDFDVIIIGSGIGGLISAGILASRGLKTLLIEKNPTPGGYLASFRRGNFIFDSAVDCISGVAPGGLINKALKLLNVDKDIDFVRVSPVRLSIFPDIEVNVDSDMNAYLQRLTLLFPSERDTIKNFFTLMDRVYRDIQLTTKKMVSGKFDLDQTPSLLLKLRNISYKELLDEYILDARLKSILSDRCPFIGLPPSRASAFSMIAMIMSYFKQGAYRPVGGFQKLADTFIKGIMDKGGMVIFGNGVKKILLKNNHCCGIQCENGDEYTAEDIVSNMDFVHTFNNLLGGEHRHIAEHRLKNTGVSISFFIVYAAITGDIDRHSSIGYFPSYDMESFFMADRTFQDDSTIGITIASIEDKTRAPAGCHTVVVHEMVESFDKKTDKAQCAEKIIKKAGRVIPELKDRIQVLDAASPQTLMKYSGNFNGAAFGWRQIPGNRSTQDYGIDNLSIAGHWGDMGGGVLAAAYSGAKAACDILQKKGLICDI